MQKTFTSFVLLLLTLGAMCQESQKLLKEAIAFQDNNQFEKAIPLYREVLMYDNLVDAKKGLARCYREVKDFNKAEYWYKVLLNINPGETAYVFHYAQMLQNNGKCDEAKEWFLKYAKEDPRGFDFVEACEDVNKFTENEDNYALYEMPFNTEQAEFGPMYLRDGLVYTGGGLADSKNGQFTDLYFTQRLPDYSYTPSVKLKGKVNSNFHDGPACFNAEGTEIWFTRTSNQTSKDRNTGEQKRNLRILYAEATGENRWGEPQEFPHNNAMYSMAHPSLSIDGSALFFVSDKPDGYGGTDIYVSYKRDSTWSPPLNLGPSINTLGNELFPFLHHDGTLYFASNGHAGMGGLDIFTASYKDGKWSKPKNMGSPINSTGDDFTIILDYDKSSGYFASNRYGSKGGDDVYYFELKDRKIVATPPSDPLVSTTKAILPGIPLDRELGLNAIKFAPQKASLNANAYKELSKVIDYLDRNPGSRIIVEAHTDSRETSLFNQNISQERANNIKEYLLAHNISEDRVNAIGYGETQLLNHCAEGVRCSEIEHAENERIIIKLDTNIPDVEKYGDEPDDSEFLDFGVMYEQDEIALNEQRKRRERKERNKKTDKEDKASKKEQKQKEKKYKKEQEIPNTRRNRESEVSTESNKKERKDKENNKKERKDKVADIPKLERKEKVDIAVPQFNMTDRNNGITFRVHTGPYREISVDLQKVIQDLRASSKIELKGAKEIIVLGVFPTIADAEKVRDYIKKNGFNKTKIVVYNEGIATKENYESLRKKGFN